jgi:hypothetical protein
MVENYKKEIGWKIEFENQKKLSKDLMKLKKNFDEKKTGAYQATDLRVNKSVKEFIDESI